MRSVALLPAFVVFAAGHAGLAQTSETFGGNIVLGRPTDRSITVNVLFTSSHESAYVEYGGRPGALDRQTPVRQSIRANVPYQEVIEGLEPGQRYYYRVRYKKTAQDAFGASKEHTFHTQRPRGSTFTFTVAADSHLFTTQHCSPQRYAQALANARADNPDFHLDLGDTFRSDTIARDPADLTYELVVNRAIAHRPFFNIVTADAPLFLANGNHDSEYGFYSTPASGKNPNLPLWATNARVSLFPNPLPDTFYSGDKTVYPGVLNGGLRQSYYAWEWGDALFVVLDPYWEMTQRNATDWAPVHGNAQYSWFRDTLRNSKARYKFVFEHHVLGQGRGGVEVASQYEWGGQDPRRTKTFQQARPGWDKPMHQLMVEAGVNLYIQGHDHLFAKAMLDGVTYVTVPMPGAGPPGSAGYFPGNETSGNFDAYSKSLTLPNSGHLRVIVSPAGVKVEYVAVRLEGVDPGVNGEVAYSFTVAGGVPPSLAVVSSASYGEAVVAPGSIATAFGNDLPASGGTVLVRDSVASTRTAQILAQSETQISFVVPEEAETGMADVSVFRDGATVASGRVTIQQAAPALFSANATGFGVAAAVATLMRDDGTQSNQPVFTCGSDPGGCVSSSLDMGSPSDQLILSLFGTGLGKITTSDVFVQVGASRADVLYAGRQGVYPGLDQINVRVPRPEAGSGEVAVVVAVAGKSVNVVTVNLK